MDYRWECLYHKACFLGMVLLTGCCSCPILNTANRVADSDFSQRADGALLSCAIGEEYVMRVKIVRSEP